MKGAVVRKGVDAGAQETPGDDGHGWYLYGITRPPLPAALAVGPVAGGGASGDADAGASLRLLESSGLGAVVRSVRLADFSPAVLRERLRSEADLETMVRSHNRVIEAVHARQPILPARLGMVYAHARDIVSALRSARGALTRQLVGVEGRDEWAVHVRAERAAVRERIAAADPGIRRLRQERAGARPGRAYFLERHLRDELEAATRHALVTVAQEAFDRLTAHAVASRLSAVDAADRDRVEILRAAFLVPRDGVERFEEEVRGCADADLGLVIEYSGPWPPYSFAAGDGEEAE